MMLYILGV